MMHQHKQDKSPEASRAALGQDDQPRYWLTAICATLAALGVHLAGYYVMPFIVDFHKLKPLFEEAETEEVIRIVARPVEENEVLEILEPDKEIELIEEEPEMQEIDIIDIEYEELVMAPGETMLPPPDAPDEEPFVQALDNPSSVELIEAAQQHAESQLAVDFSPLNANPMTIEAQVQTNPDINSDLLEGELLSEIGDDTSLPADTKSLSDLLKVEKLGKASGVARLGADVLFSFGESSLRNSARVTLIQLAALIRKNPDTRFIIEGHTDSYGGREYNALLSLQRAAAVRDWLEKNKLPIERVYLRACADTRPLTPHSQSKAKQSLNRRVEIHMRRADEALPPACVDSKKKVDSKTKTSTLIQRGVRATLAPSSS